MSDGNELDIESILAKLKGPGSNGPPRDLDIEATHASSEEAIKGLLHHTEMAAKRAEEVASLLREQAQRDAVHFENRFRLIAHVAAHMSDTKKVIEG